MKNIKLKIIGIMFIFYARIFGNSPDDFKTEEFLSMGGLDLINADKAYAKGYTGKGVTVGLVDYFVNFNHPEFINKENSFTIGEKDDFSGIELWTSHGNWVGGIIAASKNNQGMHGVAFNSNIISGEGAFDLTLGDVVSDLDNMKKIYNYLNPLENVKVIHNGWVNYKYYLDEIHKDFMYGEDYQGIDGLRKLVTENEDIERDLVVESTTKYNKLLIFPNGNNGHLSSNMPSMIPYINPETKFNIIGVSSLDVYSQGEKIFVSGFSDLNKYNEENSLSSYGAKLYSSTVDGYIKTWGTSAAAPLVTGTGLLVQEAFPYLTGKQIGDVLLSTADKEKYKNEGNEYVLTFQPTFKDTTNSDLKINLITFKDVTDINEIKKYVCDYFKNKEDYFKEITGRTDINTPDEFWNWISKSGYLQIYNNVPYEIVYGQGIVDAGKAVDGLGALNGRRLTKNDRSDNIQRIKTLKLSKQAIYSVNTMGYDSVWKNDISEIKAGYMISSDKNKFDEVIKKIEKSDISSEKIDELKKYLNRNQNIFTDDENDKKNKEYFDKMFEFYLSGKNIYNNDNKQIEISSDNKVLIENGLEYILEYNKRVEESELTGLSVGLFKEGEGILSLAGNNTYKGATISGGGTIQIDGSVIGDTYSISDDRGTGIIAGSGTIKGNLYNYGKIQGGSYGDTGTLTVDGNLISKGGTIVVNVIEDKNSSISVGKVQTFENTKIEINGIVKPDSIYKDFLTTKENGAEVKSQGNVSLFLSYKTQLLNPKPENNTTNSYDLIIEKKSQLNSLKNMNKEQKEISTILENMYSFLEGKNEQQELYSFYNVKDEKTALKAYQEVYGGIHSDMIMNLPLKNISSSVYSKISNDENFLSKDENQILKTEDSIWTSIFTGKKEVKDSRGMGTLDIDTKGFILGTDIGKNYGYFVSYGENKINENSAQGEIKDFRGGIYGNTIIDRFNISGYTALGIQKNETERTISLLNKKVESDYDSWTFEGSIKGDYSLTENIKPYVKVNFLRYENENIKEKGGGIFSQKIEKDKNFYSTAETGIEFIKEISDTRFLSQIGYEKVLTGNEPELNASFSSGNSNFKLKGHNYAEDYFVIKTGIKKQLKNNIIISGEGKGIVSSKDKDYSLSLHIKYYL